MSAFILSKIAHDNLSRPLNAKKKKSSSVPWCQLTLVEKFSFNLVIQIRIRSKVLLIF